MRFDLLQKLVSCRTHASGTSPKSATSPAKRRGTSQLTLSVATTDAGVRNQANPRTAPRQKGGGINISSGLSDNDVSHTEMNQAIRRPQPLTGLHHLSRRHLWISNETTNRDQHLGTKTRFQIWVDRHELLVDHCSRERDASRHWSDDFTTERLLKVNRSVPGTEFARWFDIRKYHCPAHERNQTIRSSEYGKKNHQSLCAASGASR